MSRIAIWLLGVCLTGLMACGNDDEPDMEDALPPGVQLRTNTCGTYPVQETSPFILPYSPGEAYEISQGNCTNNSHRRGTLGQFAYDFRMPIGTNLVASRAGVVVAIMEDFPNVTSVQKPGEENFIIINNVDGTQDRYFHLDQNGVDVEVGQNVRRGTVIGRTGNSGGTPFPHLHFEVIRPNSFGGEALPVTFSNTVPHPMGLVAGETYQAN